MDWASIPVGDDLSEPQPADKKKQPPLKMASGKLELEGRRVLLLDVAGGLYKLKKTLRGDVGAFERDFTFRAGEEGAHALLRPHQEDASAGDPRDRLVEVLSSIEMRGFGEFQVKKFEAEQRLVEISCANCAEAWAFLENNDLQRDPTCSFTSGMLRWICRRLLAKEDPLDMDLSIHESECVATGGSQCIFVLGPEAALRTMFPDHAQPKRLVPEQVLRLNEEILSKNLDLQNINLSLERLIKKKTEETWRAEENYGLLMRLLPDPVALILTNGRIHSMNPMGLRMFGFETAEEAHNESIATHMTGGRTAWDRLVWQIEKEGLVRDFEVELQKKDGSKISAVVSARLTDLVSGRCVETVIRDLSERRQMERQIDEAKSESEFLNDLLSHDIMNFTFSALHFMNRLWKSQSLSEEDRRELAMSMKDIQGAYELTSSVRDLARIKHMDQNELIIKDLKHLLVEASEETRRLFPERVVTINYERSGEPRYARCTPIASRLFTNILTNAVKYDPKPEAVVDIVVDNVVESGEVYWRTRITDTGRGIPDAEKEKIFQRFHRLDQIVTGTGLGLYVARFIAEAGGGRVWAENRVEGDPTKGTVMVVLLRKADERDIALMPRKP